jgi:SAM-dependent methyltransferase
VAADAYRLPFVDGLFDAATMIRVLHHMADAPAALRQVHNVLQGGAIFILEYANKRNLKAVLRYLLHRQAWSPFSLEPVEFAALNFDFHPRAVRGWLEGTGFEVRKVRTVSHFRLGLLKRLVPARLLAGLDAIFQPTGTLFQLTPSVFVRAQVRREACAAPVPGFFKCPECGGAGLEEHADALTCPSCRRKWSLRDGIYDFRQPL